MKNNLDQIVEANQPKPYTVAKVVYGPVIWPDGFIGREVLTTDHRIVREMFDDRTKFWVEQFFSTETLMLNSRLATAEDLAREGVPT